MVEKKGVISTGVDILIKIVKDQKEISVPAASKLLNVPESTVEAWASFLEEEGLLTISYKFTTAYLYTASPKEKNKAPQKDEKYLAGIFVDKKAAAPAPQKPSLATAEINQLVSTTLSSVKRGDFKNAKDTYSQVRELYETLPYEFEKKKEELVSNMIKLNKAWITNSDKFTHQTASTASEAIKKLISNANSLIKKDDIHGLIMVFGRIKEEYQKIPPSLIKEKILAEELILIVQENIIELQGKMLSSSMNGIMGKLSSLIPKLESAIESRNVNESAKLYSQVNSLRKSIPSGFLEERIEVENKILSLYTKLTSLQITLSKKHVDALGEEITKLLGQIHLDLEKHNFKNAFKLYAKTRELYSHFPYGFVARKIGLQKQMLHVLKALLDLKITASVSSSSSKSQKIHKLLEEAEVHLKSKDNAVAKKIYREMGYLFSSMPKGFANSDIETEIIDVYSKLVGALDKSLFKKGEEEKYLEILHLLVRNHELIQHREFDLMLVNFDEIQNFYDELPDAVRTLEITNAVSKVEEEVELFNQVKELKKFKKTDFEKVKELLEKLYTAYKNIEAKCPEDSELFSYIRSVYILHLNDLAKNKVKK